MPTIPIWAVALAVAAIAPFVVRFLADTLDARVRAHTREILRTATDDGTAAPGGEAAGGTHARGETDP